MKIIPLRNSNLATVIDDEDFDRIAQHGWSLMETRGGYRYAQNSQKVTMHRLITDAPPGMIVDHRDGDGLNNRRENLRICTHRQNVQNSKVRKGKRTSVFKGVAFCKNPGYWRATIRLEGRSVNLGNFRTEQEAVEAYREAATKHFGEFAKVE